MLPFPPDAVPPLSGVRVLEAARVLAGPFCGQLLADLGADVIKLERPGTGDDTRGWGPPWSPDGVSAYYLGANRNKRSIALDLKDPDDLAVARALAMRSDVVVENYSPGAMARAGLDHERLAETRPDIISCRIAGIGRGDVEVRHEAAFTVRGCPATTSTTWSHRAASC